MNVKGRFILAASTDENGVTSLFPDFFSRETSLETRAIWLISHEVVFFWNHNASFEEALQAYINNPTDYSTWMPVYDSLAGLNMLVRYTNKSGRNLRALQWTTDLALYVRVLQLKGKKLTLADFVPDSTAIGSTSLPDMGDPVGRHPSDRIDYHHFDFYNQLSADPITLKAMAALIDSEFSSDFIGRHLAIRDLRNNIETFHISWLHQI